MISLTLVQTIVVPEATCWLTINYLSFIHGVIADVHDRPWVCLSGSVRVLGVR